MMKRSRHRHKFDTFDWCFLGTIFGILFHWTPFDLQRDFLKSRQGHADISQTGHMDACRHVGVGGGIGD